MANNNGKQTSGTPSPIGGDFDREAGSRERRDPAKGGHIGQSEEKRGPANQPNMDDDIDTAGGREGNFADSERGDEGPWSPGSTQPSDK